MTEPAEPVRVVCTLIGFDNHIVLDNHGAGRVLAAVEHTPAAERLAHLLRGLPADVLADLWERC